MDGVSESVRQRMPQDLLQFCQQHRGSANLPVCEQESADVATEVISDTPEGGMKAYFPTIPKEPTAVVLHFPGGKPAVTSPI